jgi:TolB-like protein/DNA-binding winged helix-turn-helix (wHTH) protein/Tfp pilus assembly protein PilF
MNERVQEIGVLRFGPFELERCSGELRRAGVLIKLQAQQSQLLLLLAGRSGEVVTRDEIRRSLWGENFVDFDRSINLCVNKIREALDDNPQNPRFIETLPRKGYRFIAPVAGQAIAAAADPPVPPEPPAAPTRRWLPVAVSIAIAAAVAVAAYTRFDARSKSIESLAVLPFENLSNDTEQDYFASGMTDELIAALSKVRALRVISRTSVMQYKGTKKPVSEIARELGVDAIVEGTVTRDRARVRITAQLIAASPERHLWAERYESSLGDVLAIQDNVASAVAREVRIKVTPRERSLLTARRTVEPAAYEPYLRALYLNPTEENLKKQQGFFQEAIDKDPTFAPAWTRLAVTYELMAAYSVLTPQAALPKTRAAAEKALQLDANDEDAAIALATVKKKEWNWAEAERDYKHVLDLYPNNAFAHMEYAGLLAATGRAAQALAESRRARELAPDRYFPNVQVAWYYYVARQYAEAESESRKLIEWEPGMSWGYICQASAYLQTGRQTEAVEKLQRAVQVSNRSVFELMYLGHALGVSGRRAEANSIVDEMIALSQHRYVAPEFVAMVYEGLGDRERAIEWFRRAYASRSFHIWVLDDPRIDAIRSDPRFKELIHGMGVS